MTTQSKKHIIQTEHRIKVHIKDIYDKKVDVIILIDRLKNNIVAYDSIGRAFECSSYYSFEEYKTDINYDDLHYDSFGGQRFLAFGGMRCDWIIETDDINYNILTINEKIKEKETEINELNDKKAKILVDLEELHFY